MTVPYTSVVYIHSFYKNIAFLVQAEYFFFPADFKSENILVIFSIIA